MIDACRLPVKVILPYRPHLTREAGFHWVCAWYACRFGLDSIHVELDPGNDQWFNKSAVINRAVKKHPGHVVVIADADCVVCDGAIRDAVSCAEKLDMLIVPHNRVCRCNEIESAILLQKNPALPVSGRLFRYRRTRRAAGGMWAIKSDLFNENPMDENFIGWGAEDTEYTKRMKVRRFPGPLFHFYHEKADLGMLQKNQLYLARKMARHPWMYRK